MDGLGQLLLSKQAIERAERMLRRTLLFNLIEEMEDVRIESCKVVGASVKYSTRKLVEVWEEFKREREKELSKYPGLSKPRLREAIRKAEEREEERLREFVGNVIERMERSNVIVDLPIHSTYNFFTRFY